VHREPARGCDRLHHGRAQEQLHRDEARPVHLGRTTHVWDAVVLDAASRRQLALVRCTQLVLWAKRD
jgi:1,4-dihydroxy-2-naphthoyl-CoA hydrolase